MRLANFDTIMCYGLDPERVVGAPPLTPAEARCREEQLGAVSLFEGDSRAAIYRAWRRRGHPAMACLRIAYGPHYYNRRDSDRAVFDMMGRDLPAVMHEVCARAADEAEGLCVEWLEGECWRPDDGAAEAARVVWAASNLVDEASVRAWVAARLAARAETPTP